jgi:hypothetical protein
MSKEPVDFEEVGQRIEEFLDERDGLRHLVPGFNSLRSALQNASGADPKGEPSADDPIDYRKINKRVERRLKQKKDFQGSVLAFFIVTGMAWMIFLLFTPTGPAWPLILMVLMAIIVVWTGLETYVLSEGRERERDRLLQREIERERLRLYGDTLLEKPKRERPVRLSDDGELVYGDEPDKKHAAQRE